MRDTGIDWDKIKREAETRRKSRPILERLKEIIETQPELEYDRDSLADLRDALDYIVRLEQDVTKWRRAAGSYYFWCECHKLDGGQFCANCQHKQEVGLA